MFTMCTQVIDLLLQGFEKEWNTASPKRSFFKFKNLRVLVSFLIFFLWTACSSYKVFLSLRWGMVCVLLKFSAVEQHGDSGWNVTCLPWYQALHLFIHPALRRFFTPSRSTSPTLLRTAKLLLLPPKRIKTC